METLVETNGTTLHVRVGGDGPALVLLHGWPHTGAIWDLVRAGHSGRTVIAPDLRGIGRSAVADAGFDAATQAADVLGLLDALGFATAEVAAIDAAVPAGFLLGAAHPSRITGLTLMEGLLPGGFPVPPWWFGFHAIPGLAEAAVVGNEAAYLDFFLASGSVRGVPKEMRDDFVAGYTGIERLRAGFGFYRVAEQNAAQIAAAGRLTVPTRAIGGSVVGDRLHRQLAPITDRLRGEILADCAHLVPVDRPDALVQ